MAIQGRRNYREMITVVCHYIQYIVYILRGVLKWRYYVFITHAGGKIQVVGSSRLEVASRS